MTLPARTIADIYKERWQIEIFFRFIKQNLKIKSFLGNSENAVLSQVYVALIAYLLLAYQKFMSFYERFEQVVVLVLSAVIAVIIVVSLIQLISIVFSLLIIEAFNPLDHKVFQSVFGMRRTRATLRLCTRRWRLLGNV